MARSLCGNKAGLTAHKRSIQSLYKTYKFKKKGKLPARVIWLEKDCIAYVIIDQKKFHETLEAQELFSFI